MARAEAERGGRRYRRWKIENGERKMERALVETRNLILEN
jgi:IS4 transposase